MYELERCMSPNSMIQTLESSSIFTDHVKNENIELVPRLTRNYKVSVKARIAPLRLKFEFFDINTKKKIAVPDATVYISTSVQQPTIDECLIAKTEFKEEYVKIHSELQRKVIPEYHPINKKDRFPQEVYVSLHSHRGCFCTITVCFPEEKKTLAKYHPR